MMAIAASIVLVLTCASCKDKNCPDYLQYQVPYTVSPIQDTFDIGDTIWIEMNFADQLTDLRGGIANTFSDFDFNLHLECGRFDIDPPQGKAVSFMDAIAFEGEIASTILPMSGVSFYKIVPFYIEQTYSFKGAVVLKQQGTFLCGISPSSGRADPFEIKGNCNHLSLEISSKVNNGDPAENNYHLLKSSPVPVYRDMTVERFGQGAVCFVVR